MTLTRDLTPWKGLPPRRWAFFEDEDHSVAAVTEDGGDFIAWPEMDEHDVAAMVAEHNAVVAELRAALGGLDADRLGWAMEAVFGGGGWLPQARRVAAEYAGLATPLDESPSCTCEHLPGFGVDRAGCAMHGDDR